MAPLLNEKAPCLGTGLFSCFDSQNMSDLDHEAFMREAIAEASRAEAMGEVPVGAVAVYEGRIISRGHNLRETTQDPTSHAELLAIREAATILGSWRLTGVSVYVT